MTERCYPTLPYVGKFPDWGWLVGSGIYIDDVNASVASQASDDMLLMAGVSAVLLSLAAWISGSITRPLRSSVLAVRAIDFDAQRPLLRLPFIGRGAITEL